MKKTLLDTVQDIEQDAANLLAQAKERAAEELSEIKNNAETERVSIQKRATQTSDAIIHERIGAAKQEASKTQEQSKSIVTKIHTTAEQNKERALLKAKDFFNNLYGTSL